MKNFYKSLFKNDSNFFVDFNKYLAFQTDSKSISDANSDFKLSEFQNNLNRTESAKFYCRINSSFELNYPEIVLSSCDIFFMLYNKMMDKICYNPNLISYIEKLDKYIFEHFIDKVSLDLQKLSEYILIKDIDDLNRGFEKIYS